MSPFLNLNSSLFSPWNEYSACTVYGSIFVSQFFPLRRNFSTCGEKIEINGMKSQFHGHYTALRFAFYWSLPFDCFPRFCSCLFYQSFTRFEVRTLENCIQPTFVGRRFAQFSVFMCTMCAPRICLYKSFFYDDFSLLVFRENVGRKEKREIETSLAVSSMQWRECDFFFFIFFFVCSLNVKRDGVYVWLCDSFIYTFSLPAAVYGRVYYVFSSLRLRHTASLEFSLLFFAIFNSIFIITFFVFSPLLTCLTPDLRDQERKNIKKKN